MNFPRSRLFWSVALGHFTNDTFMSMMSVLLAFISVNILPMSKAEIGLVLGITALVGALTQPVFGLLADRSGGRWLGTGGVAWTVGMVLLALLAAETGIYALMIIGFIIPAMGSGAFHPVGSKYAAESDKHRAASNMAYFFLMGQLGLALGPALAGRLLDHAATFNHVFTGALGPVFGSILLERGTVTPVLLVAFIAIPALALMAVTIPNARAHRAQKEVERQTAAAPTSRSAFPVMAFIVLIAMVTLRSLAQPGTVNFIPVLFQEKGWSPAEYGLITSSFWVGSGLAGVFFGNLADRFDRRKVIAASMIASAPAFFFLPVTDGALAFALAIAAGALSGASHSIIVVLAQGLLPGSKALASGLILGLIFGMGAMGSFLIGGLAEFIGLGSAFQLVAGAVVLASVLALALPRDRSTVIEVVPEPVTTRA
ncbi:MAG: MFS transporter [Anaerolineae bacterium]|nr:MFS transporter [Anaerolineae bacterium]